MTLLEVVIAMIVVSTVLMSSAYAFSASVTAMVEARRMTSAAAFLESVMENVNAQPYANLAALNGNQFFDNTNANDSRFGITLTVFAAQIDLLQIRAVMTDLNTGNQLGSLTTLRSNR
jgi:type II secretory pathway pseudopilin PulG